MSVGGSHRALGLVYPHRGEGRGQERCRSSRLLQRVSPTKGAEVTASSLARKASFVQFVLGVDHEGGECFLPSVAAAPAIAFLRTKSQGTINWKDYFLPLFFFFFLEGWWVCLRWIFPKFLGMKNVPVHPSEVVRRPLPWLFAREGGL